MNGSLGFRDAIHVPFVVVHCDRDVQPGTKCSLRDGGGGSVTQRVVWEAMPESEEPMWHGVADPFVERVISAGTPFRFMLRPECFRGMRHDFDIEVHDRGGTNTCHSVCDIF